MVAQRRICIPLFEEGELAKRPNVFDQTQYIYQDSKLMAHTVFFGNFRSDIQTWESTSFGAKLG